MWIARDRNGALYLFSERPRVDDYGIWHVDDSAPAYFLTNGWRSRFIHMLTEAYPEVTFENSPKELVIEWDTK